MDQPRKCEVAFWRPYRRLANARWLFGAHIGVSRMRGRFLAPISVSRRCEFVSWHPFRRLANARSLLGAHIGVSRVRGRFLAANPSSCEREVASWPPIRRLAKQEAAACQAYRRLAAARRLPVSHSASRGCEPRHQPAERALISLSPGCRAGCAPTLQQPGRPRPQIFEC